jgi:tetratricopeptide (TPR) repeat protein
VKYSYSLLSFSATCFFIPILPAEAYDILPLPSAVNHRQVVAIAKQATVMIVESNPKETNAKKGSGVIIKKKENEYTVLTNRHVVCESSRLNYDKCLMPYPFALITPDGQKHHFDINDIQVLPNNLDISIVRFRSNQKYVIGQLSDSSKVSIGSRIHTAGYDATTTKFMDDDGSVIANGSHLNSLSNEQGYNLMYNAYTNKGMSGSAVWNSKGQIVAIHGQGLRYTIGAFDLGSAQYGFISELDQKYGWNKGIPVNTFIRDIERIDKDLGFDFSSNVQEKADFSSESNYYLEAVSLAISSPSRNIQVVRDNKIKSLEYLHKSLKINPNYSYAHFLKVEICRDLFNTPASLCNIKAEENERLVYFYPNSSKDYFLRAKLLIASSIKSNLPKAFEDYSKGIDINPDSSLGYIYRGDLKQSDDFNDYVGAMDDYNRAIFISPKDSAIYSARAWLKSEKLDDLSGALSDYNKAWEFSTNPNDYMIYWGRAIVKEKMKDLNGAIHDLRLAVERSYSRVERDIYLEIQRLTDNGVIGDEIRNSLAETKGKTVQDFLNSAKEKASRRRCSEAIADYNSIMEITKRSSSAYFGRAECRSILEYPNNAILSDYMKAIQLNPELSKYYFSRAIYRYSRYKRTQYTSKKKESDEFTGILSDYKKALSLDLNNPNKYNSAIAELYFDRGIGTMQLDHQLSLNDYNKAIEIYPKGGIFYLYRGRLKRDELKDTIGAKQDFQQALQIFRSVDDTDTSFIEETIKELNSL